MGTRPRRPVLLLAAMLGAWAAAPSPGAAQGQAATPPERQQPPLLPTPGQLRARAAAQHARALEQTLQGWPGVAQARVHIALPDPTAAPLDGPPAAPSASVSLRADPRAAPEEEAVARFVADAVAGLEAAAVQVAIGPAPPTPAAPARPLARVGPFAVAPESEASLRWTLAGGLALVAALALGLMLTLRRARRSEGGG